MAICSDIKISAAWHSNTCRHREDHYFQRVDIEHRIDIGRQTIEPAALQSGKPYRLKLLPGDLIPARDLGFVRTLARPSVSSVRRLVVGQYYPTELFLPAADGMSGYVQLTDLHDNELSIDMNHPLSDSLIHIDIRIIDQHESTAMLKLAECLQIMLRDGPGMQACNILPEYTINADNTRRLDETDDALHYQQPDFEDTFDRIGGQALSDAYAEFLQPGMRILDIMCGAQSYLPSRISGLHATGIGLNEQELQANRQLAEYFVHNVNRDRKLPFEDNQFDAIVFTAAVEYLVDPHETFRELHRITRPNGTIIVSFTDHWNSYKNIALWQELPLFERLRLVMTYLGQGGNISKPGTLTIRGLERDTEDRRYPDKPEADPVFICYATVDKP